MSTPRLPRRPVRRTVDTGGTAIGISTPIGIPVPTGIPTPTSYQSAASSGAKSTPSAPSSKKRGRTCPNCDGTEIEDYGGQSTCLGCGTVVAESDIVTEITFGETSQGAAVVQGGMVAEGQQYARTMGKAFRRMGGGGESREQSLRNGRDSITALAGSLHVPHSIDPAVGMFSIAHSNGFVQGRPTQVVAAICLYIACRRQEGNTVLLIDIAEKIQINVYALGSVYKAMIDALYLNYQVAGVTPVVEVEPLLLKYAHRLEFGEKTNAVAADAAQILSRMNRDWMVTGRTPNGLCGACLILAARMNNFRRSIREVVYVVKTSDATLQQRLSEFKKTTAGQLTIEDFRKYSRRLKVAHDPPSLHLAEEKANRIKRIRQKRRLEALASSTPDPGQIGGSKAGSVISLAASSPLSVRSTLAGPSTAGMLDRGVDENVDPAGLANMGGMQSSFSIHATATPTLNAAGFPISTPMPKMAMPTATPTTMPATMPTYPFAPPNTPGTDLAQQLVAAMPPPPGYPIPTIEPLSELTGQLTGPGRRFTLSTNMAPTAYPGSSGMLVLADQTVAESQMVTITTQGREVSVPADIAESVFNNTDLMKPPRGRPRKKPMMPINLTERDLHEEEVLEEEITALLDYDVPETVFVSVAERAKAQADAARGVSTVLSTPEIGEDEFADDPEVATCLLNEREIAAKEKIWVSLNADWLRDQQLRMIAKEKAVLLGNGRPSKRRRKQGRMGDGSLLRESGPVSSAAEATARMLEKRLGHNASKKVNYDLLRKAYGGTHEDMTRSLERAEKAREEKKVKDAEKRRNKRDMTESVAGDRPDFSLLDDPVSGLGDGDDSVEVAQSPAGFLPTPPATQVKSSQASSVPPSGVPSAKSGDSGSAVVDEEEDGEEVVEEDGEEVVEIEEEEEEEVSGKPSRPAVNPDEEDEEDEDEAVQYADYDDEGEYQFDDPEDDEAMLDQLGFD